MVQQAQKKAQKTAVNFTSIYATQLKVSANRNVDVPSQLEIYCNMMELMRLRHEIILAQAECHVLQ